MQVPCEHHRGSLNKGSHLGWPHISYFYPWNSFFITMSRKVYVSVVVLLKLSQFLLQCPLSSWYFLWSLVIHFIFSKKALIWRHHRRIDGSAACDSQRLGINSRTYGTTGANYQHRTGWVGILFQYVLPGDLLQLKLRWIGSAKQEYGVVLVDLKCLL